MRSAVTTTSAPQTWIASSAAISCHERPIVGQRSRISVSRLAPALLIPYCEYFWLVRAGNGARVLYFPVGTIGRTVAWGFVLREESPGSTGQVAR